MNKSDVAQLLLKYWHGQNLCLNAGISPETVAAFEAQNDIELPREMSNFLLSANGFAHDDLQEFKNLDENGFCFLSLNANNLISPAYMVFCKWPYGLLRYAVYVRPGDKNGEVVLLINESKACLLAGSFSEFVRLYLADSPKLYSGTSVFKSII